ncbi:MAG: molybdopterin-dependent oxidoreductase [Thermoanaerobaculia bacterium]|nr:molybdopterin-dependent oxidoreductase [Thermoanaerobaculia bacterium]
MATFLTACPRNCYSTCSLAVTVENGRLVRVEGVPANRATPEGPCLKGLAYVERSHSPDRVVQPLARRRDGSFAPVGWDEALDRIAGELAAARAELGPQSVLFYAGSGSKGLLNGCSLAFWRLFGGCTTTYGDLCWPAGLEATRLTLGDNRHNAPWDLEHARLILFWGKNPAETNVHQMLHLDRARERGARVVVIDPRRTETAARADRLLQIRPGSDGALALGLGHVLAREGWIDRAFVDAHVLGYEAWAVLVAAWPPARAAAVTGLSAEAIEELARWLGTVAPVTIVPGFGMQRFTNSGQAMRAMLALLAVTGQIGRPGAGWMYANLQTAIFSAVKDPLDFYPPERPDGVVRVGISTARLGREMEEIADPPLAVAWVERGNPIPQNPETGRVVAAFRRLRFRVVVDEFLTDTAREADLVLPAKTFLEQSDVIGAYWHPYLHLRPKVMEPPPGVLPETEIYRALGRRLGIAEEALAAALPGPDDEAVLAWLGERLRPHGLSLDALREGPVLAPGAEEVAFADLRFPTPSGRVELASAEASERWGVEELPQFREPEEAPAPGGRFPLALLTPNTKNRIHSQFGNLAAIRRLADPPRIAMHPDDAAVRGLADGQRARLFNDRGELLLPVHLDWGLRPGCVAVTNGFWLAEGGAVNLLSRGRETDLGHGAAFHDNAVEVARA